ncbi:farnesyl-diphosphate farnesyltransferase [Dentipellis sp. KUC8613]|nr:farnesyl-diphosphate farnesyltransferase [Dentipellis sp. KUC8613]
MGALSMLTLLLTHPHEFRTLVQFYLYHEPKRDITAKREHDTSGWDRASMRRCWELLDLTSRSFAAVVKELEGDLARAICLFYVVLRGLDTIEDDMTIPDDVKQPLLRSFHEKTLTPGWTFNGNGPDEKDRIVLVDYDKVVTEVGLLKPAYRDVIISVCQKMQVGMADYAHRAATTGAISLDSVADYDLYCHFVAGLVGEGLSSIWAASGLETALFADQLELSNSMGLLLQKTNIIRDFREDCDERRFFWPREVWARAEYGAPGTGELKEITALLRPENAQRAAWVQSGMVLDALRHAVDALDYLRLVRNQSVFNFCAIPAVMAMATLNLCFMNPEMFQRNIKIRKAEAAKLIMRSTNPREVAYTFREYARSIHKKATPADPNFLRISVACCKIEQWAEHHFPSFVHVMQSKVSSGASQVIDPNDARSRIAKAASEKDALAAAQRQPAAGAAPARRGDEGPPMEVLLFAGGMVLAILGLSALVVWVMLKIYD